MILWNILREYDLMAGDVYFNDIIAFREFRRKVQIQHVWWRTKDDLGKVICFLYQLSFQQTFQYIFLFHYLRKV